MKRLIVCLLLLGLLVSLGGCTIKMTIHRNSQETAESSVSANTQPSETEPTQIVTEPTEQTTEAATVAPTTKPTEAPTKPTEAPTKPTDPTTAPTTAPTVPAVTKPTSGKRVIVIDAGHQRKANTGKEPVGPGSSTMKTKVSGGTRGTTTGLAEYELNLQVSVKLQKELERRGYTVIMIRTSHDVDMSNSERAAVANAANADAFIRIHANGSDNPDVSGAMTICQTKSNPYNGNLYAQSKALSSYVLDEFVKATGCRKQYVWETDTMSGINWCQVPVTIVEMGYMTNPTDDRNMASDVYQDKMVEGIANGIDRFFQS